MTIDIKSQEKIFNKNKNKINKKFVHFYILTKKLSYVIIVLAAHGENFHYKLPLQNFVNRQY